MLERQKKRNQTAFWTTIFSWKLMKIALNVALSATATAVAAPKTKKIAKRSCTILHGVPKTLKSHFSPVIHFSPNGSIALKIRILNDHDMTAVMPCTAF